MNFLLRLYWKWRGDKLLDQKFRAMTLPQLNLLEARMRAHGDFSSEMEQVFEVYRAEKMAEVA